MTTLDPTRTALMLMDFQVAIVGLIEDDAPLLEKANAALADARAHGATVGWVRVAFTDEDFDAIPDGATMAGVLQRRTKMHADSPATQIDDRLSVADDDVMVRKVRVGAFTTTDLDEQLHARGIDTLVLAGISSSGVVLSTVREAMDRDYRIVVLEDACADPDAEVHAFLHGRIFPGRASVISVADLATSWA